MDVDEGHTAAATPGSSTPGSSTAGPAVPSLAPEELARLVEGAADAIVVADPDGRIVLWNASATRLFGHEAERALGQSLDLIIPTPQRARHWEGYETVMATGQTRYGTQLLQVPALHADGSRLSIAFTVSLLTAADGRVTAIAAILRDETARFNEDRDLRRRLRELEAALATPAGEDGSRPAQGAPMADSPAVPTASRTRCPRAAIDSFGHVPT